MGKSVDLGGRRIIRSEEHTSELQSHDNLVCRLLLEKKKETAAGAPKYKKTRSSASHKTAAAPAESCRWCVYGRGCTWYLLLFFLFFFFFRCTAPPRPPTLLPPPPPPRS